MFAQNIEDKLSQLKVSRSRAALTAYHPNNRMQLQAKSRSVYQAQLESMALKEEQGAVKEEEVLGLFLLIILSIQFRGVSSFSAISFLRNGARALFDAGFDDEATGSSLERILSRTPCVFPPTASPLTLSEIANSCNKEYSSEKHIAYAAKIIQKSFLFMRNEPCSLGSEPGTFFTLEQKKLAYKYSYLCAMQDIFSFVEAKKIAMELFEPNRSMAMGFLKIIENTIACLSKLSEHIALMFPETTGEEHAIFRVKAVCFLVVFRVYLEVKKSPAFQKLTNALGFLLRNFFVAFGMASRNPLPIAEEFVQFFFNQAIVNSGLFSGVNEAVYALLLSPAPQQAKSSFIKWAKESDFLPTKQDDALISDFLLRAAELRAEEMQKLLTESLGGTLVSLVQHVNERCNLKQKMRLLNVISTLTSYSELADNLQIICQFDLNIVLEERLIERYIDAKITVSVASHSTLACTLPKSMTLRQQMQAACADRVIIYIYREYFQCFFSILEKERNIPEELLQSNEPYEQWCENELLKQRSANDAKKLCEWFKENRSEIEDWYKRESREYGKRWNDVFLTEVKISCLLLAENSSLYQDKRTQLTEIFNATPEMQAILTPYAFYEILDSFEHRLGVAVAISGRANIQEKEQALLDTMEGINRDMAGVLLTTSQPSVTGRHLLKSMLDYVEGDEPKYLALLQDLLGSNCPSDNCRGKSDDKFQLEKYFLANALLFNLLGYLFVYAHHDKASLCAWGGYQVYIMMR